MKQFEMLSKEEYSILKKKEEILDAICFTNADIWEFYVEKMQEFYKEHPNYKNEFLD